VTPPPGPGLLRALEAALGGPLASARRVGGGDNAEAWRVEIGGERLFVKRCADPAAPPAEAAGLRWLGEVGALRVPAVRAVSAPGDAVPFLALEWIAPGEATPRTAERTGRGLAALHRARASARSGEVARPGWDRDNFIGALPQDNTPAEDWAGFYGQRRLLPQLRAARGRLPGAAIRDIERVIERLPALVGPPEPMARLHGDLWGGNRLVDEAGEPWLIDPAAYAGHREVDLAMMRLFGGFSPRCFAAYQEAAPLAEGWEARVPLYQLYYLLVHVNLFGAGYAASAAAAAREALRPPRRLT
jgi:fructosamine-3-kinase